MADFSIQMKNRLRFSSCEAPHKPTTPAHEERLVVELSGDLITLTELRSNCALGKCIRAQRTVDLPDASIFMILPELPPQVRDGSFFPAIGTVVLHRARQGEKRHLVAVGTDNNSGRCHGWIFDAWEE
jgi:hypothetical protein